MPKLPPEAYIEMDNIPYFKDDQDLSWSENGTISATQSTQSIILWRHLEGRYASASKVTCDKPFNVRLLIGRTMMKVQKQLAADVPWILGNGSHLWEVEITPTERPAIYTVEAIADYHNTPPEGKYRLSQRIGLIERFIQFFKFENIPGRWKGGRLDTPAGAVHQFKKKRLTRRETLITIPPKKRMVD